MTEHNHCTECGAQLPDEAKFCPKCGTERSANVVTQTKDKDKKLLPAWFSILAIILTFVFIWWFVTPHESGKTTPKPTVAHAATKVAVDHSTEAYIACRMGVEKLVDNLSKSDFPASPDSVRRLGDPDNQKYKLDLHFNKKKASGITMRSHWSCTTTKHKKDDDMWAVNQLSFVANDLTPNKRKPQLHLMGMKVNAKQREDDQTWKWQPLNAHNRAITQKALNKFIKQCSEVRNALSSIDPKSVNVRLTLHNKHYTMRLAGTQKWPSFIDVTMKLKPKLDELNDRLVHRYRQLPGNLVEYYLGGGGRPGILVQKGIHHNLSKGDNVCGQAYGSNVAHKPTAPPGLFVRQFVKVPSFKEIDGLKE